ncbi:DEAD/DEAH box helicase [Paenibacillus sp. N1-5-1-14]|uniref:DEAD/DEAH box helicase n=1 Tax=Paenibacillus radicibacter TaxID=2972488 RepID=UPI0021597599|nr:DEAD/DEAH box helicase [Paenibacillus radicibacter]MCR8641527.1 DEAD/DEAH box helicase [Paenibacillus radicibacter]
MSYKLRDYQIECIEEIESSKKKCNLAVSSVGSGKTVIFSELSVKAKGRVLILTPSTELREQAESKLKEINPEANIGSVQADLDDVDAKIVVSTRQSLTHSKSTRLKRMLEHGDFEYLIVDEAHQAPKQIKKVLSKLNDSVKIIGFTATPYTRECIEIFGQPIFRRTILDMIDSEYLVEPYAMIVQSKTNISHVKTTSGDFAQGELEDVVNNAERNQLIIESYKKFGSTRKLTLVFAAGCEHGKELLKEFQLNGIASAYIDGETSREVRKELISKYKKKEIKVLINVMTLTTGFDVPETDCVIICRPTKSRILYEQIIGRGLRLAEGKSECLIVDIQDITKKHDLMDISCVMETKIKNGETYRKAKERNEEEKRIEQVRKQEEEKKSKERELVRQKELEIVAKRIKLINRDMKLGFESRKLDWFRVDTNTYSLTYGFNTHYVIEGSHDKFAIYDVSTDKDSKHSTYIDEFDNVVDAITYIEKKAKLNTHTDPNADWKKEPPTEGQKKYCGWAKTKVDAARYFSSNAISGIINKQRRMG